MGAKPHDSSPFQQEHLAYAEVAINALSDQIRSCIHQWGFFGLPPINFGIAPINVKIVSKLDKNSGNCASKITRNIMSHNCIYDH